MKNKFRKARKGTLLPLAITYILLSFAIFGFAYDISNILYYKVYLENLASTASMSMTNQCYYYGVGYEWVGDDGITGDEGYFKMGVYDPSTVNVIVMPHPTKSLEGYYMREGGNGYTIGVTTSGISVTSSNIYDVYMTQKDIRDGKIRYADEDFLREILEKQSFKDDDIYKSEKSKIQPREINIVKGTFDKFQIKGTTEKAPFAINIDECKINRGYNEMDASERSSYDYIYYDRTDFFNRFIHGRDSYNGECEIYLVGYVKLYFTDTQPFDFTGNNSVRIDTYAISQPRYLQYDTPAANVQNNDNMDGESLVQIKE